MMLRIENIDCFYDNVQVLHGLSLQIQTGEIRALLGRNGAGKTTLLKTIMGLIRPRSGRIVLDGVDLTSQNAHEVPRCGVAYVPQGRGLFPRMSVAENLRMGMLVNKSDQAIYEWVLDLFPVLRERLRQQAGTLSGGEQQMLATARALCLNPKLLLLDEPSEGVMPRIVDQMMDAVAGLKARGMAVLLVEQKIEAALRVADQISFIEHGVVRHETTPAALAEDPEPLSRYLGVPR